MKDLNKQYEEYNAKAKSQGLDQIFVGMKEEQVRLYMIDMLSALDYCHKVIKVIHRDIKPDNIMINHNNEAVLIDFGVSALFQDTDELGTNMGSYIFFAPEMFLRKKGSKVKGEPIDIWALGVTFFFLLTGQYPFAANDLEVLKLKVTMKQPDFSLIKNKDAAKILKRILEKDVDKRAKLEEIINSDWLTKKGTQKINEII